MLISKYFITVLIRKDGRIAVPSPHLSAFPHYFNRKQCLDFFGQLNFTSFLHTSCTEQCPSQQYLIPMWRKPHYQTIQLKIEAFLLPCFGECQTEYCEVLHAGAWLVAESVMTSLALLTDLLRNTSEFEENLDRLTLLVAHPPQWNCTTMQN